MYIHRAKQKTRGKIYTSTLLQETYRENGKIKHRTLMNLSKWSANQIKALEMGLKGKSGFSVSDIESTEGKFIGGLLVFKKIAERMGIEKSLGSSRMGKISLVMIIARLLTQGSRRKLNDWQTTQEIGRIFGISDIKENEWYNALDWLENEQDMIEKKLVQARYSVEKPKLFLYDVTSSYLEGDQNELSAYGYNRDKKKGKKQIVIGLMTDESGVPIAIRVFEGNTSDSQTVSDQIRILSKNFEVKEITLVGDRGMIKSFAQEELTEHDFHFITALTKPQIEKMIKKGTFQLSLFDKALSEIVTEKARYILKRNPLRVQEIEKNRQEKIESLTQLTESLTTYLQTHEKAKEATALRKINAKITRLGLSRFCTVKSNDRHFTLEINTDAQKKETELDGCYVIHTDLRQDQLSAQNVHDRYKDLAMVEKAFRTIKTGSLEIRPLFVRKSSRTKGHVFLTMLAYMLIQNFWNSVKDLGHTLDHAVDLVSGIKTVILSVFGQTELRIPIPAPAVAKLLTALKISLPKMVSKHSLHTN